MIKSYESYEDFPKEMINILKHFSLKSAVKVGFSNRQPFKTWASGGRGVAYFGTLHIGPKLSVFCDCLVNQGYLGESLSKDPDTKTYRVILPREIVSDFPKIIKFLEKKYGGTDG